MKGDRERVLERTASLRSVRVHGALTSVLGEVSCLPGFYKEGRNPKTSPVVFSALKPQQLPPLAQEFKSKAERGFQLDLQERSRTQPWAAVPQGWLPR